jgi:hypothetical protein
MTVTRWMLTCDGPVHYGAILELNGHRLVVQFH